MKKTAVFLLKLTAIILAMIIFLSGFSFAFCGITKSFAEKFTDITKLSLTFGLNPKEDEKSKTPELPEKEEKSEEEFKSIMTLAEIPKKKRKAISVKTIGKSGANLSYDNVFVRNVTKKHTVDIKKLLAKKPDIEISKDDSVQVLIMHTHTTECYMPYDLGVYSTDWQSRSFDSSENVVAVGRVLCERLNEAGIKTVQAEDIHDKKYTGAYDKSEETVKKYLEKYPTIQVVLDLHRDAITYSSGTKLKPTIEINGKNAAQIMIINGCEEGTVENYPDWQINMIFSLHLQKALEDKYPGLARPLYFAVKKYNQHLTHGSILIEMGSEANTLDEAKYSAELLSDSLISLLNKNLKMPNKEKS